MPGFVQMHKKNTALYAKFGRKHCIMMAEMTKRGKRMDYVRLYHDLLELLPNGSIQELMKIAYQHVHLPILATDVTYQLLGIYPKEKSGKPYWDLLLEKGKYDTKTIMELYEDEIMQSADQNERPYLVDWGRAAHNEPKIVGLIKVNGHTEGFVSLLCKKEDCSEELLGAVEIIAKVCSILYQEKRLQSNIAKLQPKAFINELLRGKINSREQLLQWQQNTAFYLEGDYMILMIEGQMESVDTIYANFCAKLSVIVPTQLSLIHQDALFVIIYDVRIKQIPLLRSNLASLLSDFHLQCGCSICFNDLLQCQAYIEQARYALKTGTRHDPGQSLYEYPSYALLSLIENGSKQLMPVNSLHPIITSIQAYDKQHHSELYDTLACYVYLNGETALISERLHIHRNSLAYRLRKIEEISGYSLKNFRTLLHLSIHFYLAAQKEGILDNK